MKKTSFLPAAAAIAAAAGLLFYSEPVADGVRAGLHSCAALLIPSLFPFMILAAIVGNTRAGQRLSYAVSLLLTPLTGLPRTLGAVYFMSILGGFPVGARMLSQMLERGEIDAKTASRALCCSVNAGPSFLIAAVGAGLFGSRTAGLVLLGAQLLSSLCLAGFAFRGKKNDLPPTVHLKRLSGDALVGAVRSSASGMLGVCSFVIAFSALSALLRASGILPGAAHVLAALFPRLGENFFHALLNGILEVTTGCIQAASLRTREGFVLCAFLVSFSSFSILAQIKSSFSADSGVNFSELYRSRVSGGLLSAFFALLGWQWMPQISAAALSSAAAPVASARPEMLVTCGCLIGMFTIILLCPPSRTNEKRIVNIFK